MKKRISPASGLEIKGVKQQYILFPCAALLLAVLAFVFLPYIEVSFRASAASSSQTQVGVGITQTWASLRTSGDVNMNAPELGADGMIVSGRADVIAATNAPTGYKLYLSASGTNDSSSAAMTSETSYKIDPMANAATNPAQFSTLNTWGYALKGSDHVGNFSSDYSEDLKTKLFKGASHLSATPDGSSAEGLIAQATAPRSSGARTQIYYAAYVSNATPAGTYSADLTYTLVADYATQIDPNDPANNPSADPNRPAGHTPADDKYAYTEGGHTYYYGSTAGQYYYYDDASNIQTVTALGVNKVKEDEKAGPIATVANINDGNITWAAIAIVAGASATFLAIALLRDREDSDD